MTHIITRVLQTRVTTVATITGRNSVGEIRRTRIACYRAVRADGRTTNRVIKTRNSRSAVRGHQKSTLETSCFNHLYPLQTRETYRTTEKIKKRIASNAPAKALRKIETSTIITKRVISITDNPASAKTSCFNHLYPLYAMCQQRGERETLNQSRSTTGGLENTPLTGTKSRATPRRCKDSREPEYFRLIASLRKPLVQRNWPGFLESTSCCILCCTCLM